MPLFDAGAGGDAIPTTQLTRPGQFDQTGSINAAAVIEYRDSVEHTIARQSVLAPFVPIRSVRGTNQIGNYGFGKSTIGVVVPGEAPAATVNDIGRTTLTIDTVVYTRHALPLLEVFQTSYDARVELGVEDGQEMAKFHDQAFFIQAAKAASLTQNKYSSVAGKPAGFGAGSRVTLASAGDATDPARLYQAISDLFVQMAQKDVVPNLHDVTICVGPAQYYALLNAEQLINVQYVTARGTRVDNVMVLKAFGCPVVMSNNMPTTNITGHLLSTTANGNAYNGDFTKLIAVAVSPKAFLAGETIPLTSDVFYDKIYKMWFVDSHRAFGVTPDRAEYAGAIWLP